MLRLVAAGHSNPQIAQRSHQPQDSRAPRLQHPHQARRHVACRGRGARRAGRRRRLNGRIRWAGSGSPSTPRLDDAGGRHQRVLAGDEAVELVEEVVDLVVVADAGGHGKARSRIAASVRRWMHLAWPRSAVGWAMAEPTSARPAASWGGQTPGRAPGRPRRPARSGGRSPGSARSAPTAASRSTRRCGRPRRPGTRRGRRARPGGAPRRRRRRGGTGRSGSRRGRRSPRSRRWRRCPARAASTLAGSVSAASASLTASMSVPTQPRGTRAAIRPVTSPPPQPTSMHRAVGRRPRRSTRAFVLGSRTAARMRSRSRPCCPPGWRTGRSSCAHCPPAGGRGS